LPGYGNIFSHSCAFVKVDTDLISVSGAAVNSEFRVVFTWHSTETSPPVS
jgi:hypothetical protein